MHIAMLAAVSPDNSPHGYNWTFAFPMLLFIIITGGLYVVLTRPHKVPGHGTLAPAQAGRAGAAPDAAVAPGGEAARAAAVASGFTTAAGGGAGESPAEPGGAHRVANLEPASGNVSDQDASGQDASGPSDDPADAGPSAGTPTNRDPEATE
ncbi:MAG: hypothetical protein ACLPUO_09825 [Streptosporangiaceae bacterium]